MGSHKDVIDEILDSPGNELVTFIKLYCEKSELEEGDNKFDNIFDTLKLFISGEISEMSTPVFLAQYYELSKNTETYCKLSELMREWTRYVDKKYDDNEKYEILDIILHGISILRIETSDDSFNLFMTKKIWEFECFRKLLKHHKKLKTGQDYEYNGLFRSLFIKGKLNNNFHGMLNSIEPLINDETIHNHLVSYIHNILTVNIPYTYDDMTMSEKTKCSGIIFNIFLMKIVLKLMRYHSVDEIIKTINNGDKYTIKNYEIDNLPFFHRVYTIFMFCIQICHVPAVRAYNFFQSELAFINDPIQMYSFLTRNPATARRDIELKISRVKALLTDNDNIFIQKICYVYKNICHKLQSDDFFGDVLAYSDAVMSLDG
jgi:hypothetical protein